MNVRSARSEDAEAWVRLRGALWPDWKEDHATEIAAYLANPPEEVGCLVAEVEDRGVIGFVEVRLRDYAEGCESSPVGYLEGIYVEPEQRRSGVGRALVRAAEAWARERGCEEMGSDRGLDNAVSGAFHESVGFQEVVRMVAYRKLL